jgi:hypothetical protein
MTWPSQRNTGDSKKKRKKHFFFEKKKQKTFTFEGGSTAFSNPPALGAMAQ